MVDEICNEIYIDPLEFVNMKEGTDKSWQELKDEVLHNRNNNSIRYLKDKYSKNLGTLQKGGLEDDEIILFLMNVDALGSEINDALIKEYKTKKIDAFQKEKQKGLSDVTKKKYNISDKEADKLTEEQMRMFEKISKDTGKPVKDIMKSFLKSIKN